MNGHVSRCAWPALLDDEVKQRPRTAIPIVDCKIPRWFIESEPGSGSWWIWLAIPRFVAEVLKYWGGRHVLDGRKHEILSTRAGCRNALKKQDYDLLWAGILCEIYGQGYQPPPERMGLSWRQQPCCSTLRKYAFGPLRFRCLIKQTGNETRIKSLGISWRQG